MKLMRALGLLLPLLGPAAAQTTPTRYEAKYTKIYSDDFETMGPALAAGFQLEAGGSLTSNAAEVVSGKQSVKGTGTGSFLNFLRTDSSVIPLAASGTYRLTFRYRGLTALSQGFSASFYSGAADSAHYVSPPGIGVNPAPAETGSATLTATLGPYSDYQVYFAIAGTGSVTVDEIQIVETGTSRGVASDDMEGVTPLPGPGLQLNGASGVAAAGLVIAGKGSIQIGQYQSISTIPAAWPLAANTVYIVEFQYRVLSTGPDDALLSMRMEPASNATSDNSSRMPDALRNMAVTGTFSSGTTTGATGPYVLRIWAHPQSTVVIDNLTIYRRDAVLATSPSQVIANLGSLPFPRLAKFYCISGTTDAARYGWQEKAPLMYSVDQLEKRLAEFDAVLGLGASIQAEAPDFLRRMRNLNPSVALLGGIESEDVDNNWNASSPKPCFFCDFYMGVPDQWKLRTAEGSYEIYMGYPYLGFINMSDYAGVVDGNTWGSYFNHFLTGTLFAAGVWDGMMLDGLYSHVVGGMLPNWYRPDLFDADYNRNGLRDETVAQVTEWVDRGTSQMLQQLQNTIQGTQLLMSDTGKDPEPRLAPYVNGYILEYFNLNWDVMIGLYNGSTWLVEPGPRTDELQWRRSFDLYQTMEANVRRPSMNLMMATGQLGDLLHPDRAFAAATALDILKNRFSMGTSLLADGLYGYDLYDCSSAPYWFDEFSVGADGKAVEDLKAKGYLGAPLGVAQELVSPATLVMHEDFESGTMPNWNHFGGTVSVSHNPNEIISGTTSLVLNGADHNRQYATEVNLGLNLTPGTHVLQFDWRILETLDGDINADIHKANGDQVMNYGVHSAIAGESGTTRFPFTVPSEGNWSISFRLQNGGKVALDNINIYKGGAGPWRRDFENGLVLVNPINAPYTFSASEIAGSRLRTGVRRISGTQAPDVNNGQPVTGNFTLQPFDAIILLADHLSAGSLPKLTATKTHTGNFTQGQNGAMYTVVVGNTGQGPTSGSVSVTESLPSGLTMVSMNGSGWSCTGNTCLRSDPLSAAGSFPAITVVVNVAANAPAQVTNQVTAAGGRSDPATASDPTNIATAGAPSLSIAKTHSGNFTQGQQGTYTLTVSNSGTAATNGAVTVTENVPAGETLQSMSGIGWTCASGGNTCSRGDALGVGGTYPTITVTVNVASGAAASVTNQVSVSGGGSATANASDPTAITAGTSHPAFFSGEAALSNGVYYLQFANSNLFGYYSYLPNGWIYHIDMGYEFVMAAGTGVYMWDFASGHWLFTTASNFPYLYDFNLNTWIFYFTATGSPGHYTANPRWFANMTTSGLFTM